MNIKESIQQINELIEAWELNEACLNQTDIDAIKCLLKQNQELKKQLEDKEDYINKLQATKDKLDKWDYENTMQQKEFINYLEDEIKIYSNTYMGEMLKELKEILQKYKSIIGVSNENN